MSGMGDVDDIKQVKYRYLRALDTKHWDEFADTLTDDVIGDYDASIGESHHFTDRDSLVEFMRSSMPTNIITEHRVTHPEISVNGDEASATWYLQDRVIVPDFNFLRWALPSTTTGTAEPATAGKSVRPVTTAPTTRRCRRRTSASN